MTSESPIEYSVHIFNETEKGICFIIGPEEAKTHSSACTSVSVN